MIELRVHPSRYELALKHPEVIHRSYYETVNIVTDKRMPTFDSEGKPILGWWVEAEPLTFPKRPK